MKIRAEILDGHQISEITSRSLSPSVQRQLNARRFYCAREEDYIREHNESLREARGRGRPKRKIEYLFTDDGALLYNQNLDDEEMSQSEENLGSCTHNQIVKSINFQIYNANGVGDQTYRLLATRQN